VLASQAAEKSQTPYAEARRQRDQIPQMVVIILIIERIYFFRGKPSKIFLL